MNLFNQTFIKRVLIDNNISIDIFRKGIEMFTKRTDYFVIVILLCLIKSSFGDISPYDSFKAIDDNGDPVSGATVRWWIYYEQGYVDKGSDITDDLGLFSVEFDANYYNNNSGEWQEQVSGGIWADKINNNGVDIEFQMLNIKSDYTVDPIPLGPGIIHVMPVLKYDENKLCWEWQDGAPHPDITELTPRYRISEIADFANMVDDPISRDVLSFEIPWEVFNKATDFDLLLHRESGSTPSPSIPAQPFPSANVFAMIYFSEPGRFFFGTKDYYDTHYHYNRNWDPQQPLPAELGSCGTMWEIFDARLSPQDYGTPFYSYSLNWSYSTAEYLGTARWITPVWDTPPRLHDSDYPDVHLNCFRPPQSYDLYNYQGTLDGSIHVSDFWGCGSDLNPFSPLDDCVSITQDDIDNIDFVPAENISIESFEIFDQDQDEINVCFYLCNNDPEINMGSLTSIQVQVWRETGQDAERLFPINNNQSRPILGMIKHGCRRRIEIRDIEIDDLSMGEHVLYVQLIVNHGLQEFKIQSSNKSLTIEQAFYSNPGIYIQPQYGSFSLNGRMMFDDGSYSNESPRIELTAIQMSDTTLNDTTLTADYYDPSSGLFGLTLADDDVFLDGGSIDFIISNETNTKKVDIKYVAFDQPEIASRDSFYLFENDECLLTIDPAVKNHVSDLFFQKAYYGSSTTYEYQLGRRYSIVTRMQTGYEFQGNIIFSFDSSDLQDYDYLKIYKITATGKIALADQVLNTIDNTIYAPISGDGMFALYGVNRSGELSETKVVPDNVNAGDRLGTSVCISGATALAGMPHAFVGESQCGSVVVLEKSGQDWIQTALLTPPQGNSSDNFGAAVGLN